MSDAAFREALDAYHDALLGCQCTKCGGGDPADAAHARVLALYEQRDAKHAERQGEEAVVTDGTPDGQYIELRFVQSTRITDGDRVWVVKVEEAK